MQFFIYMICKWEMSNTDKNLTDYTWFMRANNTLKNQE